MPRRLALLTAFLVLAGVLAGCIRREVVRTMIPAPILMQDERLDFARIVAPEDQQTDVRVLFATTRAPARPDARERFSREPLGAIADGTARRG